MPGHILTLTASLALFLAARPAAAAWPTDPLINLPVCVASGDQGPPRAASDGADGVVIAWLDQRAGGQVYAQRVSASGTALWTPNGNALGPAGATSDPMIAEDAAGGVVIAWVEDSGSARALKAQRLDANGLEQWTPGGVTLRERTDQTSAPNYSIWLWDQFSAVPNGAGGMYIGFQERHDEDNTLDPSRYTSALLMIQCDATGAVVGERVLASDQYICNHCGDGFFHLDELTELALAPGAPSGVVATFRARPIINHFTQFKPPEIRLQESSGLAATVVMGTADVRHPRAATDGAGGAIASWEDTRSGRPRLYAARLTAAGTQPWTAQGVALSGGTGDQFNQEMIADGGGGVAVVWLDGRNNSVPDVYAQRLDGDGTAQWPGDVALCTQPTLETDLALASAADGSVAFAWRDARSGTGDVYARVVSAAGVAYGSADGDAVCAATGDQSAPAVVASGTQAIAAWMDRRSGGADVYAQRIGYAGPVSGVPPRPPQGEVSLSPIAPNPASHSATFRVTLPAAGRLALRIVDVRGRRLRTLGPVWRPAGPQTFVWDTRDDQGREVADGVYWVVLDRDGERLSRRVAVIR